MKYTMINPDLAKALWSRVQQSVYGSGDREAMKDFDMIRGEFYRMAETVKDYRAEEARRNARD